MGAPKGNKFAVGKGRPRGSSYVDACRQWAEKKGWKMLMEWADGDDTTLRVHATKMLIEYGYGKAPQGVQISGDGPLTFHLLKYDQDV